MTSTSKPPKSLGSVLVIGGCGFLGHHIVSQLLSSYTCTVSVLDLRTTRNRFPNVSYHNADITSPAAVRTVLQTVKPQIIIHTASPTVFLHTDPALYTKVNIDGTRNLVERAGELGYVKAFIYTSSASIVHDTITPLLNADESWPVLRAPLQRDAYAETKGVADTLVLAANRKHANMLTTCLRPAAIFGEGDVQNVPGFYGAYRRGQTAFQLGDNNNLYDFTYVGNVAHAHILAAVALLNTHALLPTVPLDHERVDGEAFLITNGAPLYFWDFARAIWARGGDTREPQTGVWVIQRDLGLVIASVIEWIFWIVFLGRRQPNLTRKIVNYSAMTRYFSMEKARKRLGYEPIFSMEEGLERAMKWLLSNEEARTGVPAQEVKEKVNATEGEKGMR